MPIVEIIVELDAEIARLREARALLSDGQYSGISSLEVGRTGGRKAAARKKRTLSPEARQKIAETQEKRWTAQKKAAK
jgi:hypothetical protein